ncbi:MAG: leucine-rich repeat domain-containing protein [Prevotella sp.]|nr:leucine-rich repeat domain-containing protein [Prevotella sp.]
MDIIIDNLFIDDLSAWCKVDRKNYFRFKHLFLNGEEVKDLVIPNDVTSISGHAFYNCEGITSIIIPNSVTSIGSGTFASCTGLTSVIIPNSMTSIENSTFVGCTGLTSVVFPNSVTTIGESAFRGCTGLTSLSIPNSVTSIGDKAFQKCTGLTSVLIPNNVISIGSASFRYCSNLTTLILNKGINQLKSFAFGDCENLLDVYFYSDVPLQSSIISTFVDENLFKNSHIEYATLHVPAGSVDKYKSAKVWKDFGKIVPLTDEETGIKAMENESISSSDYFLLNGHQVETTQKGINIVKTGKKVKKIFVQ